jgi:hypothetical protein
MSNYLTAQTLLNAKSPITLAISPVLQRQCACGKYSRNGGECRKKREMGLQRAAVNASPVNEVPPIVHEVLRSPSQPLDASTRAFTELRFGHEFSRVQVHTGAKAADSARRVDARAYTIGRDIIFGHEEYRLTSRGGLALLSHELVHVVQQTARALSQAFPNSTRIGMPGDALEQDVNRFVATGVALASTAPTLAWQPTPSPSPLVTAPATVFHPGVNHNHRPSGRWTDVQAHPNSGFWENSACAYLSPAGVVGVAISQEFGDKPIALAHLVWYLSTGGGADFIEDTNIDSMLRTDTRVQSEFASRIPTGRSSGAFSSYFKLEQSSYGNQDFRFAFGAINRFDFDADFAAGTLHAWFQDRYEWNPVYPFYSHFPDDVARETNCVHAALVEVKSGGVAKDYWLKGEATVPLSMIRGASGGGSRPNL